MSKSLVATVLDLLLSGEIDHSRCVELFENVIVSVSPHDFGGAARRGLTVCLCRIISDAHAGRVTPPGAIASLTAILDASAARDPRLRELIAA